MKYTKKIVEDAKKAMLEAEKAYENRCCEIGKRKAKNEVLMTVEDVKALLRAIHDPNFFNSLLQRKMFDMPKNNTSNFVPKPECIVAQNALNKAIVEFCKVSDAYRLSRTNK